MSVCGQVPIRPAPKLVQDRLVRDDLATRFGGRNRVTVTETRAVPAEGRLPTRRAERDAAGARLVRRRRLFECLSAAQPGGVVVVQAPAGSGKTMLLRSWIEEE